MSENTVEKPKGGFRGGDAAINRAGRRPKKDGTEDKKTNRELRSTEFMHMVRKFKPYLSKAVKAAVDILDNDKASESGKLKASALIIATYKDLVKELYDYRYDDEDGDEIQQDNRPTFSLHMLPQPESNK